MPQTKKLVTTDEGLANRIDRAAPQSVVVRFLEPWKMIGIRVARTYLQSLVVFTPVLATGLTVAVPPGDFLAALQTAAGYSLAPAVGALIQNTLEVLADWDKTKPELRG